MTGPRMTLAELIEKGENANFLKDVLAFSLQRFGSGAASIVSVAAPAPSQGLPDREFSSRVGEIGRGGIGSGGLSDDGV